ncbi:MAG: caspase family protein, partial [Thermoplasmata archaeon]|nr:caspase family protein [Thermoplasmata archaeon]
DNDGIYDTKWLSSPTITYAYNKPYNGFVRLQVSDGKFIDECIARVMVTDEIKGEVDQSQEKADGYVKIYQQYWYAQSFKPSKCGLDGIDLLIARKGIASYGMASVAVSILSKFFAIFSYLFIGDLMVEIYKDLKDVRNGKAICSKRIEGNEISRAGSWIHINFNKKLKQDRTYYIVVHQDGGSDRQYYKWYYGNGNPYERGSSYDGNSLIWTWDENTDRDFCFRTYAHETGDEGDGIVERWAVILGCRDTISGITYYADNDAYDWKECLIRHGWDESHIKMLISPSFNDVKSAMEWLASVDDGDDLDLIAWTSHGGEVGGDYGFAVADIYVHGKDINAWLDECSAKGFCLVAESCYSEWAIHHLKAERRVILASSAADKESSCGGYIKNSVFPYFLMEPNYDFFPKDGKPDGALTMKELDANNDGWISAEEAFPYAAEKTDEYNEWRGWELRQNPQMYDGFDGDFTISYVG